MKMLGCTGRATQQVGLINQESEVAAVREEENDMRRRWRRGNEIEEEEIKASGGRREKSLFCLSGGTAVEMRESGNRGKKMRWL